VKRLRHVVEAFLVLLGLLILPPLPRGWIVRLARGLGRAGFRFSKRDRKLALANLDAVYRDTLSPAEKEAIAIQSFQAFTLVLLDLFWFRLFSRRRLAAYVTFDSSGDAYFRSERCIVVTAHFGNWEAMGQAGAARGYPCVSVAAPLKNPIVERLLTQWRGKTGQRPIGKYGAVRTLLRTLRDGGRVALLLDQNTPPEEGGMFVPLFGLPVPMSAAAGMLSRRTGAEIIPAFCEVDGQGRYRAYALESFRAEDSDEGVRRATERLAQLLEQTIRRNPGQWLWMYKRWRYVPPGADLARYPFYARRIEG
jgi:KDO2-lipid IV(A) lauroyltransferase